MNTPLDTILPGIILFTPFVLLLIPFSIRVVRHGWPETAASKRKTTFIASHFFQQYLFWLLDPVERLLIRMRVSPAAISLASLAGCIGAGVSVALGHIALAGWLYGASGMLDTLDGRVARRTGRASRAGAFLDSVLDRWAEFAVMVGLVLAAPSLFARIAALSAIVGAQMVSYTRARGEGLGITLDGGLMQRAERITVVGLAMLLAATGLESGWFDGRAVLDWSVLAVGVISAGTAARRLVMGMRELSVIEAAGRRVEAVEMLRLPAERREPGAGRDASANARAARAGSGTAN